MAIETMKPNTPVDKYKDRAIRLVDQGDCYMLEFFDEFGADDPHDSATWKGQLLEVINDLGKADKGKELHILINSYGGFCDVANALFMQVAQFSHRVTICTGVAMSNGFNLWLLGHERYVAPFSTLMAHAVSAGAFGKVKEVKALSDNLLKFNQELVKFTQIDKVLTPEEMKLIETTEVWFTGAEMIERGAAKPYDDYCRRPEPIKRDTYALGNNLFIESGDRFVEYVPLDGTKYSRHEVRDIIEVESKIPPKPKKSNKKSKKSKKKA